MSAPETLRLRGLKTHFLTRGGAVKAVDGVDLSIRAGEVLGLVGESGSGKSVTAFSILGLIDPPGRIVEGEVIYRGQNLAKLPEESLRKLRGDRIAMIFQDPMMTLNPVLKIETQMVETLLAHRSLTRSAARARARECLGLVGIPAPDERLRSYPHQLSGGMRQRVAIAIALLLEPDLIIADEPTTALDVTIQAQILHQMQQLIVRSGTALLWITHDLSVVSGLANRIAVMYAGRIVETGPVDSVVHHPKHPYTRGLIDSLPSRNKRGRPLAQIRGMTPDLRDLPPGCAFASRCTRASSLCASLPSLEERGEDHWVRCFHPLGERLEAAR